MLGFVRVDAVQLKLSLGIIVNACIKRLGRLNAIIAKNQERAIKSGAIEVLLDVLKKYDDNVEICRSGCSTLCNIGKGIGKLNHK